MSIPYLHNYCKHLYRSILGKKGAVTICVLGDVRQSNVVVLDVGDGSSVSLSGLDADAIDGVGYGGCQELDAVYGVVTAPTDGAYGETVAAGAVPSFEDDVL